jgi:hypothetical protein
MRRGGRVQVRVKVGEEVETTLVCHVLNRIIRMRRMKIKAPMATTEPERKVT